MSEIELSDSNEERPEPPLVPPYVDLRVNAESALEIMANARNSDYWAKVTGFVTRFDPGWCITLLYDHTAVLGLADDPLYGAALYEVERPVALRLRDVWDPMVRKYHAHDDEAHLADENWPEVENRAGELLAMMRHNDVEHDLVKYMWT